MSNATHSMEDNFALKIFDAHLHVGKWGDISIQGRKIEPLKNRTIDSVTSLCTFLDKHHINCAVIVPIYTPKQEEAFLLNEFILKIKKKMPDRIVPGFWIDPSPSMELRVKSTLQLADTHNITVLKTSPETWDSDYSPDPDSWDSSLRNNMGSILDYAKAKRATIQIHTGSGKSDVRLIHKLIHYAGKDVSFHLVHLGNTINGHFYLISNLSLWLRDGYQILADTSLARGFAVRWLSDLAGQDSALQHSIVFASDEPWGSFPSELAKILDATDGKPELRISLLWSNAKRVYIDRHSRV